MGVCAIPNCGNRSNNTSKVIQGVTFHKFPSDPDRKVQWVRRVGRANWVPTKNSCICSVHFTKDSFYETKSGLRKLFLDAVPTKSLPRWVDQSSLSASSPVTSRLSVGSGGITGPSLHHCSPTESVAEEESFASTLEDTPCKPANLMNRSHIKNGNSERIETSVRGDRIEEPGNHDYDDDGDDDGILAISAQEYEENVCRLCLSINRNGRHPNVLFENEQPTPLYKTIRSFNVIIRPDPHLPHNICNECVKVIDDFAQFRVKVKSNQHLLEEIYHSVSTEENAENVVSYSQTEDREDNDFDRLESSIMQDTIMDEDIECEGKYNPIFDEFETEETPEVPLIEDESFSETEEIPDEFIKTPSKFKGQNDIEIEEEKDEEEQQCDIPKFLEERGDCIVCGRGFNSKTRLIMHFLQHAIAMSPSDIENAKYCKICGLIFRSENEETDHMQELHAKELVNNHICDFCGQDFDKYSDLLSHEINSEHYDIDVRCDVECPICDEKHGSLRELLRHSVEHLTRAFTCNVCNNAYLTRKVYNLHLISHGGYRFYKPTKTKYAHAMHKQWYHGSKKVVSDVCVKTCSSYYNSSTSHRREHKIDPLVCNVCGYKCSFGVDMEKHMRTHTNERPYKCTFFNCGKTFETQSTKKHLGLRQSCDICQETFSSQQALNNHTKTLHIHEKPYSCFICERLFASRRYLVSHLRFSHELLKINENLLKPYSKVQFGKKS